MATITIDVPESLTHLFDNINEQLPIILEMGVSRIAPLSTKAYIEAIGFLTKEPSSEEIATFRFSSDIEERINTLLERNKDAELSKAEELELDRLIQLEEQLQIIKVNAQTKMKQ